MAFTHTRSGTGRVTSTCMACSEVAAVGATDRLVNIRQRDHVCAPNKHTKDNRTITTPGGIT